MKVLLEDEYIVQKAYARRICAKLARLFLIIGILALIFFTLYFTELINITFKDFLPESISSKLSFFKNDLQILIMGISLIFFFLAAVCEIIQIILNARNNVIITNKRIIIKGSGRRRFCSEIKEFESVNLTKSKMEFIKGGELFAVRALHKPRALYLLAEWYISETKSAR